MKHTFIIRSEEIASRACEAVRGLDFSQVHEVVVRPHKSNRSLAQNRTLHGWMTERSQKFAEATGKFATSKWWKEYFKEMFLGSESFEVNGKIITKTRSTADLKVGEFAEFLTTIDRYCVTELHIYLTRREDYDAAMGKK